MRTVYSSPVQINPIRQATMNWFEKLKSGIRTVVRRGMPDDLYVKCGRCHQMVLRKHLEENYGTCPHCEHHFRIHYKQFLDLVLDPGSYEEIAQNVKSTDPLEFKDLVKYSDRLKEHGKRSGMTASVSVGVGKIEGRPLGIGIHEFGFVGASLGSAEGERICRLIDRCVNDRVPLVLVCRSGGARMQEAALSLMQMAKINARLTLLSDAGLPYISILSDPTTAGVSASYALMGDINIAEPNALIGFTGERITGSSVGEEELAALRRAQRAEQVLENGFVDLVVPRKNLRATLDRLFGLLLDTRMTGS
ncbi:TPA: acetyl-CoA carboxylase carboxyl transferase subunit beta [Candidatus Latescibacteria bacterium]|nr:acetyl-CoA carboxylase carboxyl transferase subunit beta [Gemmatimonadota bacterium]HAA78063.1 acetyl-CoA carboxylase carboxyl transferase subunit beta [Candidatus Latescibacterota bacterium]